MKQKKKKKKAVLNINLVRLSPMQLYKLGCVATKCRLKKKKKKKKTQDNLSAMGLCALHNLMVITVSSPVS